MNKENNIKITVENFICTHLDFCVNDSYESMQDSEKFEYKFDGLMNNESSLKKLYFRKLQRLL